MSVHFERQLELAVEAAGGEETLQEGVEEPLVELVVDSPSVDGLGHEGLQRRPRDLIRRDVLPTLRRNDRCSESLRSDTDTEEQAGETDSNLRRIIQPGVHSVTGRAQIRLSELVLLRPAERSVTQALLDDGVEPGQEEVQASSFVWRLREKTDIMSDEGTTTNASG